jgi:hypothetical protein
VTERREGDDEPSCFIATQSIFVEYISISVALVQSQVR